MEKIKPLLPFFGILLLSLVIIIIFFRDTHNYAGLSLPLDAEGITTRSEAILDEWKIDRSGIQSETRLLIDRMLVVQIQEQFGLREANRLQRDSISGVSWEVRWRQKHSVIEFSSGKRDAEELADILKGEMNFTFDERGRMKEFTRKIGDSARLPSLSSAEAKLRAYTFLKRYTTVANLIGDTSAIQAEKHIQQPHRDDHEFQWIARQPVTGNPLEIKVGFAGNLLTQYKVTAKVPAEYSSFEDRKVMKYAEAILIVLFGIAIIIVAFQRIRSFEIGFGLAILMGILTGIVYAAEFYFETTGLSGWEMLLPLIMIPIFTGGFLVVLWAIGESLLREVWKEKFASFDLFSKGYLVHSHIGQTIIRGMVMGAATVAAWLVLVNVVNLRYSLYMVPENSPAVIKVFGSPMPWVYVLAHGFFTNIYLFTFLLLFGMSLLRRYIRSGYLLVGTGALVMAILTMRDLGPELPALGIQFLVSFLVVWTFYRYDALAALTALITASAIQEIGGLFASGNPTFLIHAWTATGCFSGVLIFSFVSLFRKQEITNFDDIAPAFARHITERQRLQQELEIARSVQMSFLPKYDPSIPEFDICSRCTPALEVGGDYYDFIEMEGKKLAVAVGDVSGKGTPAAFFMTLTKGFLRALAHVSDSPAKILTQVNHLFYENVNRGIFISMIYGVFDIAQRTLTVARAGHNPVIMRKSQADDVQIVSPAGLALGLDPGPKFAASIEEVVVEYHPGDLFIFYTDGFTEAMNKSSEEYGEERLSRAVEKLSPGSAAEILEGIFSEMKSFVGKTQQHDDMTIVVVKIK